MVFKNKNKTLSTFETFASHIGVSVMLLATMISMAELAEREGHRAVATLQPAYAYSGQNNGFQGHGDEQLRRGKEEIHHSAASYGAFRRSHFISGTA